MNYDPRIKDYHDIRCFASRNNKECLGKFGYFANDISELANLDNCATGICCFKDGEDFPFYRFDHLTRSPTYPKEAYPIFCPASETEEKKEKKFRPYTIEEFCNEGFEIIVFRERDYPSHESHVRYNGYRIYDNNVYKVILGNMSYTFSDLFEDFEYLDSDGEWKPFGVAKE